MIEGEELDDVQQSSPTEAEAKEPEATAQASDAQESDGQPEAKDEARPDADEAKPHPLDPDGQRFKQVWARGKKAEERASQLEAELQREREERIRYEERLKAKDEAKEQAEPHYTWEQLQAAIDGGQITFAKAMEIHDTQLYKRWERDQRTREDQNRVVSDVSNEMNEYKRLVPNATLYGTDERQKVEREFGYLVTRLGQPKTESQRLSMELAAARAAFGDLDTLRQKASMKTKPLTREPYMETSGTKKANTEAKKDFKSTLTPREVAHYERMMRQGRYQGGWADVQKEVEEYEAIKAGK